MRKLKSQQLTYEGELRVHPEEAKSNPVNINETANFIQEAADAYNSKRYDEFREWLSEKSGSGNLRETTDSIKKAAQIIEEEHVAKHKASIDFLQTQITKLHGVLSTLLSEQFKTRQTVKKEYRMVVDHISDYCSGPETNTSYIQGYLCGVYHFGQVKQAEDSSEGGTENYDSY